MDSPTKEETGKRKGRYYRPMERTKVPKRERGRLCAYDFETTRIPRNAQDPMTVEPRYITAFTEGWNLSLAVENYETLGAILRREFLTDERSGWRYCAWNGNRFDIRLIMRTFAEELPDFILQPFVANQAGIRGAKAIVRNREAGDKREWFFLDGIAMTGLTQMKLSKFLSVFAPEYQKMALDFETTDFDSRNPLHVAYAERDSEGLYYGLKRADEILRSLTGIGIQTTIGNLGIKFFQTEIPEKVQVWAPRADHEKYIQNYVKRGGYVFVPGKFQGKAFSYDINQAYAAAMRESNLPCGNSRRVQEFVPGTVGDYVCTISHSYCPIPFYCRRITSNEKDGESVFCYGEKTLTCITSGEVEMLRKYGWVVEIHRGWVWDESFRMTAMVDKLEAIRSTCEGGPSGPIGLMVKAIGNNAYGKTGERPPDCEYVVSHVLPGEDFHINNYEDGTDFIWIRFRDGNEQRQNFHRPQISAHITASVRCKLFEAAMRAPNQFLKADTDSVTFSVPISLPISATKYGDWKLEHDGDFFTIIGKKVYCCLEKRETKNGFTYRKKKIVCKGLSVRRLTTKDFQTWFTTNEPPQQLQVQTLNWKRGLAPTYKVLTRSGTRVV